MSASAGTDGSVRFDGKVYIVTGAARGLGAAYSRLLAARGASIVMNDFGVEMDGTGRDLSAVESAVQAITAAGGVAVANSADVTSPEGPESIVGTAIDRFGRLDGLVNNAGIISTQSFAELTPADIQRQLNVHLFGSLAVTRAAWNRFGDQGGSVVFTTSAGMLGSSFTFAYSIAKAAVYGLMRSLATEAEPLGLRVNAVMPGAETRMQGTARDGQHGAAGEDRLISADNAAALVAYLLHPDCHANGQMYYSGRGHAARVVMASGTGYSNREMTLEAVAGNFEQIDDVSSPIIETTLEAHRARMFSLWE
jgi:NAD(P)-dependent dehydrogenase (short-subunit alcohol dehydrogenase family)